jgi:hypothetical protein
MWWSSGAGAKVEPQRRIGDGDGGSGVAADAGFGALLMATGAALGVVSVTVVIRAGLRSAMGDSFQCSSLLYVAGLEGKNPAQVNEGALQEELTRGLSGAGGVLIKG